MYRLFQLLLSLVLILSLTACAASQEEAAKGLKVPQGWSGPEKSKVSSEDIGSCVKSKVAEKMDLPGFIGINEANGHMSYHSTEKVVSFSTNLVDTGYRLGDLELWENPQSTAEIYVGKWESGMFPKEFVVYKLGPCS